MPGRAEDNRVLCLDNILKVDIAGLLLCTKVVISNVLHVIGNHIHIVIMLYLHALE